MLKSTRSRVFYEVDELILCVFLWMGVMSLRRMIVLMSYELRGAVVLHDTTSCSISALHRSSTPQALFTYPHSHVSSRNNQESSMNNLLDYVFLLRTLALVLEDLPTRSLLKWGLLWWHDYRQRSKLAGEQGWLAGWHSSASGRTRWVTAATYWLTDSSKHKSKGRESLLQNFYRACPCSPHEPSFHHPGLDPYLLSGFEEWSMRCWTGRCAIYSCRGSESHTEEIRQYSQQTIKNSRTATNTTIIVDRLGASLNLLFLSILRLFLLGVGIEAIGSPFAHWVRWASKRFRAKIVFRKIETKVR